MVHPVNSSHGLLKKLRSMSMPDIHTVTGAVSAIMRNRASLSRNARYMPAFAATLHACIRTARNSQLFEDTRVEKVR
jgi:hypothetical protein